MKGKHGALDPQRDRHQRDHHRQRLVIRAAPVQGFHRFPDRGHQQVAGQPVEQGQREQEQSRADQVQHHVARGRRQRAAVVLRRNQCAGRDRQNLQKHVAGEHVVREDLRHQRALGQKAHDQIQVLQVLPDIPPEGVPSASDGAQHHRRKHEGQRRLQSARADFIAPGRRKMAHHVRKAAGKGGHAAEENRRKRAGGPQHANRRCPGAPPPQHHEERRREQRQQNQQKGDVLPQLHQSSSLLAWRVISSISSV